MSTKPEENIACCGCVPSDHEGPCSEQPRPSPIARMPSKESICEVVVGLCNRIPGSTAWNAAEFAYDEMVRRLTENGGARVVLEIVLPVVDDAFEFRHGGTTYFDGAQYRDACVKAIEAAGLKVKP